MKSRNLEKIFHFKNCLLTHCEKKPRSGKFFEITRRMFYSNQACIYLLRICTIPFGNLEMRILFRIFRLIFFSLFQLQKHITNRLHMYIYIYVCYIQLVSFQTLQTRKIWENETYFHYLSERMQLLHSCGHPCLQ